MSNLNPKFEKKIGQLIMCGFEGIEPPNDIMQAIQALHFSGVIYFRENFENPAQLLEMSNAFQNNRGDAPPLFVSVDHEGGRVHRFKGFSHFPPMNVLGKLDSPKSTFDAHFAMAEELKAVGINLNFSPVADVLVNARNQVIGDRAFGEDPELVAAMVSSAVRGLQRGGIIGCLKHYPGHGNTRKDSHFHLPKVDKSWDDLWNDELIPFQKGIKSKADTVMTAHILNSALDEEFPATMSAPTLKRLREDLQFNGVIFSDDLDMKAIADHWSLEEGAAKSIIAGCDCLLFKTFESAMKGFEGICKAAENGEITEERVDESVERIATVKKRYKLGQTPEIPSLKDQIGTRKTQTLIKEIMKAALPYDQYQEMKEKYLLPKK